MAAKPLTLLEQWLDGVPNANSKKETAVKREKKEFIPSTSSFDPSSYFDRNSYQLPAAVQPTPAHPPAQVCYLFPATSITLTFAAQEPTASKVKNEVRAIDSQSEDGLFGWASASGVFVPVIYRGIEGLVPVRIVESKVMFVA